MKIEDIISHLDKFNKTTDVTKYHNNIWDVIMNIFETTDLNLLKQILLDYLNYYYIKYNYNSINISYDTLQDIIIKNDLEYPEFQTLLLFISDICEIKIVLDNIGLFRDCNDNQKYISILFNKTFTIEKEKNSYFLNHKDCEILYPDLKSIEYKNDFVPKTIQTRTIQTQTIDIDSVLPKATSKPLKFWQEFAIKNKIDIKNEGKNKTKDELYSELLELLIKEN